MLQVIHINAIRNAYVEMKCLGDTFPPPFRRSFPTIKYNIYVQLSAFDSYCSTTPIQLLKIGPVFVHSLYLFFRSLDLLNEPDTSRHTVQTVVTSSRTEADREPGTEVPALTLVPKIYLVYV